MDTITIYHGSPNIVTPVFGEGKDYNDYGQGFYCTENLELAKEWACAQDSDGYANQYILNTENLKVLDLNGPQYNILNWLAILLENRRFSIADGLPREARKYILDLESLNVLYLNGPQYNILNWLAILLENRKFSIAEGLPREAKKYILETFLPEYKSYDIIKGYRADDSYFSYARDFISNTLSLEDLKQAMMLGKLGEQVVLKSERAFKALTKGEIIPADRSEYYARYCERDRMARENYKEISSHVFSTDEIYVIDLIRGGIKNGDPRL